MPSDQAPSLPSGRILIVTPYHRERRPVLERCIRSVAEQSVAADHLLVADGHPVDWIDGLPVRHLRLDRAHADGGNTPRAMGLLMGLAEGYCGIGLLDADNWLDRDHVEACLRAAAGDPACDYVIARRRFRRPDGAPLERLLDEPVEHHVDTSCFFFREGSYHLLPFWGTMPRELGPACDRIFYGAMKAHAMRPAIVAHATVNYRVKTRGFYRLLGEEPPAESQDGADFPAMQRWIDSLDEPALLRASRRSGVRLARSEDPI